MGSGGGTGQAHSAQPQTAALGARPDDLRSPGPVDAYLSAREAFLAADKKISELAQAAQRIAAALADSRQRERVIFYGTGIGLPWPPGAAHHAIPVLEGEWPDAARLQRALADWHAAHAAARDAWTRVPSAYAGSLPHPPAALRTDVLPGAARP